MKKCSDCGANVSCHDDVCSCCGSHNPEARSIDRETVFNLGSGQEAFRAANYEAAIQDFADVLKSDPDVFDAYFYLAGSYSALNRPAEAIDAIGKAQQLRPGGAAASYNLRTLYQQIAGNAEARKNFEKALAAAKKDWAAIYEKQFKTSIFLGQGMETFQAGNYEAAIQYFSQVIGLDPDVFDAYFYLASASSALNRYPEAIEAMEKAQQLSPGNPPVSYNLGTLYRQIGRKTEAQKQYEQALALAEADQSGTDHTPFKTHILLEMGMDAFRDENYEAAIQYFSRVIDLDPQVFEAHFYMGTCYSTLKQPAEAIQAMEKAQQLSPGSAPLAYNLGMLYKQVERKAEAQKNFEKALALAETDPAVAANKQFKELVETALKEYKRWKLF